MRKLLATTLALWGISLGAPVRLLAHGGHSGGHAGWWGAFHLWLDRPLSIVLGLGALAALASWVHARRRREA